jgi:hypothetical protein
MTAIQAARVRSGPMANGQPTHLVGPASLFVNGKLVERPAGQRV